MVLLLVGGLLSVPTTCECGAGIAHGHSLFMLPGHHHGPDGWDAIDNQSEPKPTHHHHVETAAKSGPQLTAQVSHGADRLVMALANALTITDSWQRFSYPVTADDLGDGRVDSPEAPPPRQHG